MTVGPALVSILRQGSHLIASIYTALNDSQMIRFREDLIGQIGQHRARGVVIDVAAVWERVSAYRARMRAQGLRPVQIWVPGVR